MRRTAVLIVLFLAAALAADERPLSTPVVSAAFGSQNASIATDGSAYLVVWTDTRALNETSVYATPFGADSKPAGPTAGIPALRRRKALTSPQVKWTGSSYLAVWRETTTPGMVQWLRLDRAHPHGAVTPHSAYAASGAGRSSR